MQQAGGFSYGYAPSSMRVNEMGQNSGGNAVDPIEIPNLDDLAIIERIRRESIE